MMKNRECYSSSFYLMKRDSKSAVKVFLIFDGDKFLKPLLG